MRRQLGKEEELKKLLVKECKKLIVLAIDWEKLAASALLLHEAYMMIEVGTHVVDK